MTPLLPLLHEHHEQTLLPLLKNWADSKRVPPVLLLTGPSGIGKREVARHLAQWIGCEEGPFRQKATSLLSPCGRCAACHKALSGNWVDFQEITATEESGRLKIDQFRDLQSQAGFGAHEGAYRIFLIPDAHQMTAQASNSMLKFLEEPPRGWLFFLTVQDPSVLLPTLVSRCQKIRLKPVPAPVLKEILLLEGAPEARAEICALLSQGSLTRARALAQEEAWSKRQGLFRFLEKPAASWNTLIEEAHGGFGLFLDEFESALDDLMRFAATPAGQYTWANADGAAQLESHAKAAIRFFGSNEQALGFWSERARKLAALRAQALAPLNRKIQLQDLLAPWLRIC